MSRIVAGSARGVASQASRRSKRDIVSCTVTRRAPFFHALVVAGAGLSGTECGGVTTDHTRPSNAGGVGGAAAGGAVSGDGGSTLVGTGGASPFGGTGSTSAGGETGLFGGTGGTSIGGDTSAFGGSGGTGGSSTGGQPSLSDAGLHDARMLAQWNCNLALRLCRPGAYIADTFTAGRTLFFPCPVEPSRPQTAADCGPGEWFECQVALWSGGEQILVNCQCSPMGDAGCAVTTGCEEPICEGTSRACGCAHAVILQ
jgi:hypothetical protein